MNKYAVVIKIAAWSVLAIFLTAMLFYLARTQSPAKGSSFLFNFKRIEEKAEVVKRHEFPSSEINSIFIEWGSRSVYVFPNDGNEIVVLEKAAGSWDESDLSEVSSKNGELRIKQKTESRFFTIFPFTRKVLLWEISLPQKIYSRIEANFSSGRFSIKDIESEYVKINLTSGSAISHGLKSKLLEVGITSGTADVAGAFSEIDSRCTSGTLKIQSDIPPSKLVLDLTSGNADVSIPENEGFVLSQNKISGSIKSDFELDSFGRYKNGDAMYSIKVTSGIARLSRKK